MTKNLIFIILDNFTKISFVNLELNGVREMMQYVSIRRKNRLDNKYIIIYFSYMSTLAV